MTDVASQRFERMFPRNSLMLTADEKRGIDMALNEATLVGVEVDPLTRVAGLTFSVLSLPASGPPPSDTRVQILLGTVGRVAASLRAGTWDDSSAGALAFQLSELLQVVESFGGGAIYGEEFLDVHDAQIQSWTGRVSLDLTFGKRDGLTHSISLFQEEGSSRYLDLIIWFDQLTIFDPQGREIAVSEFALGGRRWWDAFYRQDPRTQGRDLYALNDGRSARVRP